MILDILPKAIYKLNANPFKDPRIFSIGEEKKSKN